MAGTTTTSYAEKTFGSDGKKRVKVVTVNFVADAADGSVPDTALELTGWLVKLVTNPGSVAPTDNWDVALEDPHDNALDALGGAGANRDTANTEQVYPVVSGAVTPVLLAGSYNVAISGNSVNSATGAVHLYLVDSLA